MHDVVPELSPRELRYVRAGLRRGRGGRLVNPPHGDETEPEIGREPRRAVKIREVPSHAVVAEIEIPEPRKGKARGPVPVLRPCQVPRHGLSVARLEGRGYDPPGRVKRGGLIPALPYVVKRGEHLSLVYLMRGDEERVVIFPERRVQQPALVLDAEVALHAREPVSPVRVNGVGLMGTDKRRDYLLRPSPEHEEVRAESPELRIEVREGVREKSEALAPGLVFPEYGVLEHVKGDDLAAVLHRVQKPGIVVGPEVPLEPENGSAVYHPPFPIPPDIYAGWMTRAPGCRMRLPIR